MGVSLGENGGVIRFLLISKYPKAKFLEVPPTTLKKFVTGSGKGEKSLMLKEVYKTYNFDTNNDNIADAFALCKLGYYKAQYDKNATWKKWKKHEEEVLSKVEVC